MTAGNTSVFPGYLRMSSLIDRVANHHSSGNWLFQSSMSWCWPKDTWALGTRLVGDAERLLVDLKRAACLEILLLLSFGTDHIEETAFLISQSIFSVMLEAWSPNSASQRKISSTNNGSHSITRSEKKKKSRFLFRKWLGKVTRAVSAVERD